MSLACQNSKGLIFNLLYFENENMMRLRVADEQDTHWLEISDVKENIGTISDKLFELQDNTNPGDWFSFYLEFSGICNAAILAWEQYEADYK